MPIILQVCYICTWKYFRITINQSIMVHSESLFISVVRDTFTSTETLGKLYVNGNYVCETLERPVGSKFIIPRDYYKASNLKIPSWSKFHRIEFYGGKRMIRLSVPARSGICVHVGNCYLDTQGCILVGCSRLMSENGHYSLYGSKFAYDRLDSMLPACSSFLFSIKNK